VNATKALVISQVILSIALPVPMIATVFFTSRRNIMGEYMNSRVTRWLAVFGTIAVLSLNAVLLLQTFGVEIL